MIFWGTLLCWPNITISEWLVYINHEFNTVLDDLSTIFSYVVPVLPSSRKEVIAKQIRPTISEADSLRKCRCSGGKMKAQQTPVVLQSSMDFGSKNHFCVFFSLQWFVSGEWRFAERSVTEHEQYQKLVGVFSWDYFQPQQKRSPKNGIMIPTTVCMYVYNIYIYI